VVFELYFPTHPPPVVVWKEKKSSFQDPGPLWFFSLAVVSKAAIPSKQKVSRFKTKKSESKGICPGDGTEREEKARERVFLVR